MNNIVTPARTALLAAATDHRHPGQSAPVGGQLVAAELLELDLEVARRLSRRVARLRRIDAQRKELAATKRANRSTLNEIAASLGVSRSTVNRMFSAPQHRTGGRQSAPGGGDGMRHDHGTGRRRHAGAGVRRRGPSHR